MFDPLDVGSDSTTITMSTSVVYISTSATSNVSRMRRQILRHERLLFEPPDFRAVHESVAQMERIRMFTDGPHYGPVRSLEISPQVRSFRHLPRGKLDRWRSLKEKRRAWGIA